MIRVIIILFLFCFILPHTALAHSEVQVIEMTADGFLPTNVTVDENSTIIFINKDKNARWPASNVHPTHELYPEFDPKKPIQPGESWPFKPKKTGSWKYHDHLFPHMRGSITVLSEKQKESTEEIRPSFLQKVKQAFTSFINRIKKLFIQKNNQAKKLMPADTFTKLPSDKQVEELQDIADDLEAKESWNYVKQAFKGQGGSSGNIHDLAHLAGKLLYEKENFAGIRNCTSEFAFGCYHGFLDSAFAKNLDRLLDAQNACSGLGAAGSGPVASCIHGIGHGVASFNSVQNLKQSLSDCRKLTDGREYCFDGVFMEFVRSAPESFFKRGDPLYPCNELESEFGYAYSFACGRNQPSLLMGRFKMGFDEVVGVCINSTSTPFKQACFDSLGFSLAATGDAEKILAGCQKIGPQEFVARCIKAAAGELVFQEVPGWMEKSKQVCKGVSHSQAECLGHIERIIKEYNKQATYNFRQLKNGEDTNSYVREQLKICYDSGGRDGCYKQVSDVLYNQFGLANTLQVFKENEQNPEVYARCHEVTHYLSRLEYEKQGSIAKVYAQCDSTCHGGCYHGTLEAYLKEKASKSEFDLSSQFAKVCKREEDYQKPIEFKECLHGMGHGAMFVTEMELLESLKLCDTFSDQKHKERCYTGVFMENSSSSTSFDHASIYIKADDPFYPCNVLEEKYLSLCWQYQSSYFSIISRQDWKKVAKLCLQIPTKYQDRCFRTIGTNQVGFTSSLTTMKKDCDLMPSEHFKNVCVAGVVASLSYRFVGDMQKMIDFCGIADPQNRESCFKQIGNGILDWDKNKDVAKKECQKIPDREGRSWCTSVM